MPKTYSLHRLWKEQVLIGRDGNPLKDIGAIRRKLKENGCERTGMDKNGNMIYEVTQSQITKMNKLCQKSNK